MSQPLSPEELDTLRQLHADGHGRNEIARQLGRSVGVITNYARRLDLSFDRSATRAAVEARQVDLTAQRQQAQQRLMDFFNRQLDRAEGRYLLTSFDHVGTFVSQFVPEPPARETKDLASAATGALNAAVKLAQFDAEHDDKNLSAMDRFLQAMVGERPEPDE
nr:hypothetical protein OG781_18220 [Streptomyces sp. NBC_00830]